MHFFTCHFVSILCSYFINHVHVSYLNHVSDESTEKPCSMESSIYSDSDSDADQRRHSTAFQCD